MAYRFNPPPNWPIEDSNWSPPPGWQPDPSWGPAPEGWNFWVADDQPPAAPAPEAQAPAEEHAPAEEQAPAAAEDDATRVVSTGPRDDAADLSAPQSEPELSQSEPEPEQAPAGRYGAMNPYGAAPEADAPSAPVGEDAAATEGHEPHGRHAAAPQEPAGASDDDATHVADSGQQAAGEEPAAQGGAPDTAEYQGPDLEADLAQQAPYETAEPASQDGRSGAGYGAAAAAGAVAGGGLAAGAAAHGAGEPDQPGHDQPAPAPQYGQASPAPGYGQAWPAPGYGQASPAPGYGQASPAPGYGQGSASDYPAPGYGQGSPGVDTGSGWTASTGAGEPPKKGFIQRFWWLGCLLILVLVLILLIAGGIWLFARGGDEKAGGGGGTTTSQEATTDGEETSAEATTEEETTEEEPTEEETTDEVPTPTDLPTIDPAAEEDAIEIVGMDGSGTLAVHMTYAPASELESTYGGTVAEPEHGDEYLVLTAKVTVEEGVLNFNPAQFDVITPYGGAVTRSSESYSLKGSGSGGPLEFSEGEEYTVKLLFDVKRAGGNVLNFTTYTDDYKWDVPA